MPKVSRASIPDAAEREAASKWPRAIVIGVGPEQGRGEIELDQHGRLESLCI